MGILPLIRSRAIATTALGVTTRLVTASFPEHHLTSPSLPIQTFDQAAEVGWVEQLFSYSTWGVLIVASVLLLYVIWHVRRTLEEQKLREEIAAAEFEARMLALLGNTSGQTTTGEPPPSPSVPQVATDLQSSHTAHSTMQVTNEISHAPPVEESCRAVLQQLRNAGLLKEIESHVALHGNPKAAAVLKMQDGRRFLLVPYYETEIFTEQNLRRYDAILFVGRSGKGVLVRSLEDVLSEVFGK